jgi:hypothetical protein
MAFAVVTGICIALVSAMFVLASAAPSATVARNLLGTMLMIDSNVGPSAGRVDVSPHPFGADLAKRRQLGAKRLARRYNEDDDGTVRRLRIHKL